MVTGLGAGFDSRGIAVETRSLRYYFRVSTKEYQRDWHQRNKATRNVKIRQTRDRRRAETIAWLKEMKEASPCTDCGVNYPYFVMQFDHLGDKVINIGDIAHKDWSRARVQKEIDKCELVCANCHAARTHQRRTEAEQVMVM